MDTKINFTTTSKEMNLIDKIVERASNADIVVDKLSLLMDITACHCNSIKLDLEKLLNFPDFDFYHDVFGIVNNIDRSAGKLNNFFTPRCSKLIVDKKTMVSAIKQKFNSIPEKQINPGFYLKKVGTKFCTILDTWCKTSEYKIPIEEFYNTYVNNR